MLLAFRCLKYKKNKAMFFPGKNENIIGLLKNTKAPFYTCKIPIKSFKQKTSSGSGSKKRLNITTNKCLACLRNG